MINTASSTIINFRSDLIKTLRQLGHEIILITSDFEYKNQIDKICEKRYVIKVDNRSKNLFKAVHYIREVRRITRTEKPDVVFTFQTKPNTLGVLGVRKYCPYVYSMVEGLGDVFIKKSFKWKLVRNLVLGMYKYSFRSAKKVFFLNEDDREFFLLKKLVNKNQVVNINGVGINTEIFTFKKITNYNTVVMVARLLKSKGIIEYCEAAKTLKTRGYPYNFILVGSESELTKDDINGYIESNFVTYLGHQNNVKTILENSTIFVLPSYREGLPISTLEAMAIGRPVITTNSVGCKNTVKDGYNGFLVKIKDVNDLAEKIISIMSDKRKIDLFGNNSRKMVEDIFDQKIINKQIVGALFGEKTN